MHLTKVAVAVCVGLAGAFSPAARPETVARDVAMAGRNDKRTKRGKIYAQSSGNARPKYSKRDGVVDPYKTLRDWGARQDPPMSVEEVIAHKMAEKKKVDMGAEELMAALTPI